jgi:hypothetical protein
MGMIDDDRDSKTVIASRVRCRFPTVGICGSVPPAEIVRNGDGVAADPKNFLNYARCRGSNLGGVSIGVRSCLAEV